MCACCAQAALRLSAEQAEAIREAHSHFLARQRALAQQRCQALPYLQKALYSSCDLATHNYMGCAAFSSCVPGCHARNDLKRSERVSAGAGAEQLVCQSGPASLMQASKLQALQAACWCSLARPCGLRGAEGCMACLQDP